VGVLGSLGGGPGGFSGVLAGGCHVGEPVDLTALVWGSSPTITAFRAMVRHVGSRRVSRSKSGANVVRGPFGRRRARCVSVQGRAVVGGKLAGIPAGGSPGLSTRAEGAHGRGIGRESGPGYRGRCWALRAGNGEGNGAAGSKGGAACGVCWSSVSRAARPQAGEATSRSGALGRVTARHEALVPAGHAGRGASSPLMGFADLG